MLWGIGCIIRKSGEGLSKKTPLDISEMRSMRMFKHLLRFLLDKSRRRVNILLSGCTVVLWIYIYILPTSQYSIATFPPLLQNYWTETWIKRKSLQKKKRMLFSLADFNSTWGCSSQILLPIYSRTHCKILKPLAKLPHCAWREPAQGGVWSPKHPLAKQCFPRYSNVTELAVKAFLNNKWYLCRKVILVIDDGIMLVSKWRSTVCSQLTLCNYRGSLCSLTNKKPRVIFKYGMSVFPNYSSAMVQWLLRLIFHIDKKHYLFQSRALVGGS